MELFILLLMIFMHIIDDYYLQGILAKMKQKSWWKENAPDPKYRYDYLMALITHAFSWTFMIMLPIFWYYKFNIDFGFVGMLVLNVILHAAIDNFKANDKTINLIQDQLIHLLQIFFIWFIFIIFKTA